MVCGENRNHSTCIHEHLLRWDAKAVPRTRRSPMSYTNKFCPKKEQYWFEDLQRPRQVASEIPIHTAKNKVDCGRIRTHFLPHLPEMTVQNGTRQDGPEGPDGRSPMSHTNRRFSWFSKFLSAAVAQVQKKSGTAPGYNVLRGVGYTLEVAQFKSEMFGNKVGNSASICKRTMYFLQYYQLPPLAFHGPTFCALASCRKNSRTNTLRTSIFWCHTGRVWAQK